MKVVLDASVILKWLLNDPAEVPDTDRATEVIRRVVDDEWQVLQPVHWLAEVASVLARKSPKCAGQDIHLLRALQLATNDEPQVWEHARRLTVDSGQHLFDTLYHAVALTSEARLITADARYANAVGRWGGLTLLAELD